MCGDTELQDKISLLQIHADSVDKTGTAPNHQTGATPKAKMDPPKLHAGSDVQTWDQFFARWNIFKTTMNVNDQSSRMWLFNCLESELGDAVLHANPGTTPQTMTEADITKSIKQLAVKKESKLVNIIKFARAVQPPGSASTLRS